jgi:hypothetical protein
MDGSGQAYQYLIQRLGEVLPDVAAQVRAEVARGRVVAGSKLSSAEREARESRMYEAHVGKIAQADVAPVAYTDDERLALLVDSVIRVAATMQSSRHALSALNSESAIQQVTFEEPDGTARVEVALSVEVVIANERWEAVSRLLTPALEELGGVP